MNLPKARGRSKENFLKKGGDYWQKFLKPPEQCKRLWDGACPISAPLRGAEMVVDKQPITTHKFCRRLRSIRISTVLKRCGQRLKSHVHFFKSNFSKPLNQSKILKITKNTKIYFPESFPNFRRSIPI